LVNEGRWNHGIRCVTQSSQGSIANLNALSKGEIDLALVQSDWHSLAYTGDGVFENSGARRNLRSVLSLHAEPFTVVARRDAGISVIDDLKGKRVNLGPPGGGLRATMTVVMEAFGWSRDDFAVAAEIPADGQSRALCEGEIDAIPFVIGHPNRAIEEMIVTCDADLVPVTGPVIDELVANTDYYAKIDIAGDVYPGAVDHTPTFGLHATLVTTSNADGRVIHEIVQSIFDDFDRFKAMHPVLADLDEGEMQREGLAAPLHPGTQLLFWERRQQTSTEQRTPVEQRDE
jgi:TRAP transporter TAXI family solute receptor